MPDYTPVYLPGNSFTRTASATIIGGQVVESTGAGTVGPAAAGSVKAVGVAAHDAASGDRVTLYRIDGVTHETASVGTITIGALLAAGAGGVVAVITPAAFTDIGKILGIAEAGATGGAAVRWFGKTG